MSKIKIFIWVLFGLISVYSAQATATTNFLNNLSMYHTFDNADTSGTKAIDKLLRSNGTLSGGTLSGATGKLNQAYYFDGTDDVVTVTNNDYINCTNNNEVTVTFWLNKSKNTRYGPLMKGPDTHVNYNNPNYGFDFYKDGVEGRNCFIAGEVGNFAFVCNETSTLTSGTWYFIAGSMNATNADFYIDGVKRATATPTSSFVVSRTSDLKIGDAEYGDNFGGLLDEIGIWCRKLSNSEITELYNNGTPLSYSEFGTPVSFVKIQFLNQTPTDLNTVSLFSENLILNYNLSNTTSINNVYLNYSINSINLSQSCIQKVNGTCQTLANQSLIKTGTNSSNIYNFNLDDNDILPFTYNLPESSFETTAHNSFSFGGSAQYLAVEILNVSSVLNYGWLEFMINSTSTSSPLTVYYCNNSYDFGSNPTTSTNCNVLASLTQTTTYNHTHTIYSAHNFVSFAPSGGKIGNVGVTGKSYFLFRSNSATSTWTSYYLTDIARIGNTRSSINNGNTWTNITGTLDAHLHQFATSDLIAYRGCANYSYGINCTSERTDTYDLTRLPPTSVVITSPTNTNQSTRFNINYTAAVSPAGSSIGYYNISLYNSDFTYNKTLVNNSLNLGYLFDTVAFNVSIGTYKIRVQAVNTFGLSSESYSEDFYVVYDSQINLSARSVLTGSMLSGLNVTLTDATTGDITSFSSTNSYVYADAIRNRIYDIDMDITGYQLVNATLTASSKFTNYMFSLYTTNSINFTIKDEVTGGIITNGTVVTIQLISDVFSTNYTTTNGSLYVDLISPSDYTVRYGATGYDTRLYYFTLTNRSYNDITLYLLNSTLTTDVTITVYDELGNLVEGAVIKVLKYDLATNTYVLREMQSTNFEGDAVLNLVLNTEFYQFIVEYPSGTTLLTTEPTYIYSNALTFQITINQIKGDTFFNAFAVDYTLVFNNITKGFTYTFNDPNGLASSGCLRIYTYGTSITLVNSSCVNSASGSITQYITPVNGTSYIAKVYITQSGKEQLLGNLVYGVPREYAGVGNKGLIIGVLLSIVMFFIVDNIALKSVAVVLPWLFLSILGLLSFSVFYIIPILGLALIIGFITSRR